MADRKESLPAVPLIGMVASALAVAVALAAAIEWEHYRHALSWKRLELRPSERGFLFWLICAKTLWLLGPLLAVAALLRRARWNRTAALVFAGGAAALTGFLVADVFCQKASGNHLIWLLSFVGSQQPQEWAGSATFVHRGSLLLLGAAVAGTLGIIWACHWQARRAARRWPGLAGTKGRLAAGGTMAVAAFGVLSGQALGPALGLQRLEEALPVRLGWYHSDLGGFRHAFEEHTREAYRLLQPRIAHGQPVDDEARVQNPAAPNVIILVLESLRKDALGPATMPEVSRWARQGLQLERHYAGSNCSHLGIFGLLYGRTPLVYDVTLNASTPPQLPRTFRKSGYQCSFITSGAVNWLGMDKFINEEHFDQVILEENGTWPDRDRAILRGHIPSILREGKGQPQLIVAFLMSSHFNYEYPQEYEKFRPVIDSFSVTDPNLRRLRTEIYNRYRNAVYFLDTEVGNFLGRLDLKRNLVVVTGDHGESFWDDETHGHWWKGSDVQMQVPLVMAGPGVPRRTVTDLTRHADLLPTLLHVIAGRHVGVKWTHGQDIFAEGFHNDHLVLNPLGTVPNLLLIGARQRLRVQVRLDRPEIRLDGFCDADDSFDLRVAPQAADEAPWREMLLAELSRLAP
jgi:hypothetical protein